MGRARSITGKAAATVERLAAEGVSHERIVVALAADGVQVCAKTVGRHLRKLGVNGVHGGVRRAEPVAGHLVVASAIDGDDELDVLAENLRLLRADLRSRIPASDRARVSSEIRSLVARREQVRAARLAPRRDDAARSARTTAFLARMELLVTRTRDVPDSEKSAAEIAAPEILAAVGART